MVETKHLLWRYAPESPRLGQTEIHIWAAWLDVGPELLARFAATLAPAEMQRAARFHFDIHRNRYVAGRGLLRDVLGRYLQIEPAELCFAYGENGKPHFADNLDLEFNLAHSEDLAILALTRIGPIGADLERVRPLNDATELVARFFSKRESALFQKLPAEQQPDAFFNLWTRKEAWLKATGAGIGYLLGQVEVSFLPGEPARLLSFPEMNLTDADWRLRDLRPAPGFAAAIATTGDASRMECWQWSDRSGAMLHDYKSAEALCAIDYL